MENFRIQKQDHTASWPFILPHGLMINQKIFIETYSWPMPIVRKGYSII
jgi:hypothetical protein